MYRKITVVVVNEVVNIVQTYIRTKRIYILNYYLNDCYRIAYSFQVFNKYKYVNNYESKNV